MAEGVSGSSKHTVTPYDEAMDALSSLIPRRTRADKSNKGDHFDLLFDYLKMLELEQAISEMKIIHVAGTKGKGSTCTFTEYILRNYGFRTGLFTSPHLIDVRERFRLDGKDICEENFLAHFWWCYDRLKEKTNEDIPMPSYFRFLALLAFKIFAAEQVDVAILEVGLGGTFDPTNVHHVSGSNTGCVWYIPLGMITWRFLVSVHFYKLGNTLGEIAGEKAGIFKHGIPAFTVPQPDEAMCVLEEKASKLDVPLHVAPPLDSNLLNGLKLGLEGEHQFVNAGLAIALSSKWLQRSGHLEATYLEQTSSLPEQFIKGLTTACLQGRAQIVPDPYIDTESDGDLVFYLDGAHSPESMEVCARWFSLAIKNDNQQNTLNLPSQNNYQSMLDCIDKHLDRRSGKIFMRILLFNCMSVRDPQLLLPHLMKTCASHGVCFKKALFVPNVSVYYKVGSHALPPTDPQVDLSWQFTLQKLWEDLVQGDKGGEANRTDAVCEEVKDDTGTSVRTCENSAVFPSLPLAIKWLRDSVYKNQSVSFQVQLPWMDLHKDAIWSTVAVANHGSADLKKMVEAIVSFAIERIADAVVREASSLYGVREQVDQLQTKLKRIRFFLKDVDSKQNQDDRVCNCVAEVRDIAYEAEDVIDTFLLLKAARGSRKGVSGLIKRVTLTSMFTEVPILHKLGTQIESIQTKIVRVSVSMQTYGIKLIE
ncbi:hypothetical protein GH714_036293 [Hevea brasiliensis]|uniref:Folylpolyglutamate synthase n=1 Tax=Hevea brasiliensis TaxID=3981 RepID=A0A6A6L402_HEVBR|nr:hypothetical protein GH714_036293 [Hevea brasiliensis]